MKPYQKASHISIAVVIMAVCVALPFCVPWLEELLMLFGILLAGRMIWFFIVEKAVLQPGRKRAAALATTYGIYSLVLYAIFNVSGVRAGIEIFCLLVTLWPMVMYGIAHAVAGHFRKKGLGIFIYLFAVCAGVGLDVAVWADFPSTTGGLLRPDHILYFLAIAAVVGYGVLLKDAPEKTKKFFVIGSIVSAMVIIVVVFILVPRWHDIATYVISPDSDVDWVGYRLAALRGYWLHDFTNLRTHFGKEEYYWTLESNSMIRLAYRYGSWTSVLIVAIEAGICIGVRRIYASLCRHNLLEKEPYRAWNIVPYLIVGWAIRTAFALLENMFLLDIVKYELPFTGLCTIEIMFLIMLCLPLFRKAENGIGNDIAFKGRILKNMAIFLAACICAGLCVFMTQATKEKIHQEELEEKWDYNKIKRDESEKFVEESLAEQTGENMVLSGIGKDDSYGDPESYWGISSSGTLYIGGNSCFAMGEFYAKAIEEAYIPTAIVKAVVLPGVEKLDYGTFLGLRGLREVEIAASVTSVEPYAFYGCTSLERIVLHGYRTQLYRDAFYDCSSKVLVVTDTKEAEKKGQFDTEIIFAGN